MLHIYTDGSFRKPNIGAYGYVVVDSFDSILNKQVSVETDTTINKMELKAILEALKSRNEIDITIYSDSQYAVNALSMWVYGWRKNEWITRGGTPVANKPLFVELLKVLAGKRVKFVWVKAHAGNKFNEICDNLVQTATHNYRQKINVTTTQPEKTDSVFVSVKTDAHGFDLTLSDEKLKKYCEDMIKQIKINRRK